MPGPLEGLSKATSFQNPMNHLPTPMRGEVPLTPGSLGGSTGVEPAISALKDLYRTAAFVKPLPSSIKPGLVERAWESPVASTTMRSMINEGPTNYLGSLENYMRGAGAAGEKLTNSVIDALFPVFFGGMK